ncbi:arginine decarboxylase [Ardenticatena maritima]|uniref:Arginine decarboxylase n=1 Tax=Ardenticatena maritima TaxID=872965 RepID=A0A0M8K597_9CHLR|nr:hypothetical protein [Ardenticatena maritima]GAP61915.1 arginine decarboxylase [Ardenticatena maritima]
MNIIPTIGWESPDPVPDGYRFNEYLHVRNGHLFYEDLDLAALFLNDGTSPLSVPLASPLELVYLPKIRDKIRYLQDVFARAIIEQEYTGRFYYAYASKANAAEEVIRTTLGAGIHHEMSSTVDVDIVRLMIQRGYITPDQMIIANGFKMAGMPYSRNLIQLKREYPDYRIIPVIENLAELPPLIESGLPFEVGLRQKSYGKHPNVAAMDFANSRFGLTIGEIWDAAEMIAQSPNLTLRLYHGMVGSQLTDPQDFVERLTPPLEVFAQLREEFPTLTIFDFGGGVPVGLTLDFDFDYYEFAIRLLQAIQVLCARYNIPEPDIMGEMGRYTVAEHGAHLFRVLLVKDNNSPLPWYIIDGSIMSSFPDTWALGEHFIVLPLNHLDKPFRRVQLGGLTCDSDDVYPPKGSEAELWLPVETENLYIGFFAVGAYQEMLGGVGGSKHCVIPEANELIVDRNPDGSYSFELFVGQAPEDVLDNPDIAKPCQPVQA